MSSSRYNCSEHGTTWGVWNDAEHKQPYCSMCGNPWKKDGIQKYSTTFYGPGEPFPNLYAGVSMSLTADEYVEFKNWVESRSKEEPTIEGLQMQLQLLQSRKHAIGLREALEASIKATEAEITEKESQLKDAEERAKYPHQFGPVSDLCMHCGCGTGFFGRNYGKPCPERWRMRLPDAQTFVDAIKASMPEPLPVKLILKKRGLFYKMQFRTLNGNLLPPGKYVAKIVETVEVDNQS